MANELTLVTHEINSVTPVDVLLENLKRQSSSFQLSPCTSNVNVFIRPYPASQDAIKHGSMVLTRVISANDNLFIPFAESLQKYPPTNAWSAITDVGTVDIYVTES